MLPVSLPLVQLAIYAAAALALLSTGFYAGHRWQDAAVARAEGKVSAVIAERNASIAAAVQRGVNIASDVSDVLSKEVSNARANSAADAARAGALDDARKRLLYAVTELASRGRADPAAGATGGGASATGPGLVPVQLYTSVDQEAAELAAALDRSIRAGLICERTYDAARAGLKNAQQSQ